MPLQPILEVENLYLRGINFIGPFMNLCGNDYIIMAVDYVLKWVEAIATRTNDSKLFIDLVEKKHFCMFWVS